MEGRKLGVLLEVLQSTSLRIAGEQIEALNSLTSSSLAKVVLGAL